MSNSYTPFTNAESVELYATLLNVQALGKPLETDVGNNSSTHIRGDPYIQDKSITPQYFNISWKELTQSNYKSTKNP